MTPEFFVLSPAARSSLTLALVLAARAREKGLTMHVADLAALTGLPPARQAMVLREIVDRGLIELDEDIIRSPLFDDMQRPRSSAERMQALRERDVNASLFDGFGVTNVTLPSPRRSRSTEHLRSPGTSSPTNSGARHGENAAEPSKPWPEQIRTESTELNDRDLASLTPAERFVVARRHALEFANCTRSEGRNASAARSIAAGIAALTDRLNRDRTDVTVGDYLRAAGTVWQRGKETPFYKPLDVLAELVETKP